MKVSLSCFVLFAAVAAGPAAQAPAPSRPATDRWIVVLRAGADLTPLRDAILACDAGRGSVAAVDAVVVGLEDRTRELQAPLIEAIERRGGRVHRQFWIIPGCAVELAEPKVAALRAHPAVAAVYADGLRGPAAAAPLRDARNARNHNSAAVNAIGFAGQGVAVGILDSGVDENSAGSNRPHRTFYVNGDPNNTSGGGIGGSRLLVNRQIGVQSPDDIIAHGTAVAGCAAGERWATPLGAPGQAPLAGIASYSMSDLPNGFTLLSTMVAAWQSVAADRARFAIKTANLSYEGSAPPEWPEQQAMDAAAHYADIAVAVMAGNGGSSTHYSHGAINVLAVGAVQTDTRAMADFSSRGPIESNPRRLFPDLVANGVDLKMPLADFEFTDKRGSGTSYAAPLVAGAMALYRSLRPAATSLEARAAVIAATETIGDQNRTLPYHGRNAYGLGYLRTDRLMTMAQAAGTVAQAGVVTSVQPGARLAMSVVRDRYYAVALTWNRMDPRHPDWSDLDLQVVMGGAVLGAAATPFNVHEKVLFKAPASGTVDLIVGAVRFEAGQSAVAFALVGGETAGPPFVDGEAVTFGASCASFPLLNPVQVPVTGRSHDLLLLTTATAGALIVGTSNVRWNGVPLPIDLAPLGAPGCRLYVSPDLTIPVAPRNGSATITLTVPNVVGLIGAEIFDQATVTAGNALGLGFSNGVASRIGGVRR